METYFDISFEFSKDAAHNIISEVVAQNRKGYICATDGVILSNVNKNAGYRKVINDSLFSTCDSRWITKYIRWLYGIQHKQYCGSQIFNDVIQSKRYNMMFLGVNESVLNSLKDNLLKVDERISDMPFIELPFCDVLNFDYVAIAKTINTYKPDIIWIALGAPKQEYFMANLIPYLDSGVMIAVGAVFNFFSGKVKRAPKWMIDMNIEFLYRIKAEPRKQLARCFFILSRLPMILYKEYRKK